MQSVYLCINITWMFRFCFFSKVLSLGKCIPHSVLPFRKTLQGKTENSIRSSLKDIKGQSAEPASFYAAHSEQNHIMSYSDNSIKRYNLTYVIICFTRR